MAIISKKASDLSGQEGDASDFVEVVVREHPALDKVKVLDVLPEEAEQFAAVSDFVVLELVMPDKSKRDVIMRREDFDALAPNMDEILKNARTNRGRVPGTRIGNGDG